MTTESDFWRNDVSKLKAFGLVERIEDSVRVGRADVVYALRWRNEPYKFGWIELKRRQEWPIRESTPVLLPHYSIQQANYLASWGRIGSGAFLLALIENDYMLFPWRAAHEIQSGAIKKRLFSLAAVTNYGQFPTGRILRCLTA